MVLGLKCTGKKLAKKLSGSSGMIGDLKTQGAAVLVMLAVAIIAVLAMVVLVEFNAAVPNPTALINTTIAAFLAAFALFGTFAVVTALIIVVKGIVGVVKGLQ